MTAALIHVSDTHHPPFSFIHNVADEHVRGNILSLCSRNVHTHDYVCECAQARQLQITVGDQQTIKLVGF